jgi:AmmeMemoRadiSam system protein A
MNMPLQTLGNEEKKILLQIARAALVSAARGDPTPVIDPSNLPASLLELGASFVTLTVNGNLRGCIGALEAYQPLAMDVQEHAIAAGMNDYRFAPVQPLELASVKIEISRLTQPERLEYVGADDLVQKLKPGIDGVILQDGWKKATFLPQVWEKLPDPSEFLEHLCLKMNASPQLWRHKHIDVFIYQVEEFHE